VKKIITRAYSQSNDRPPFIGKSNGFIANDLSKHHFGDKRGKKNYEFLKLFMKIVEIVIDFIIREISFLKNGQ